MLAAAKQTGCETCTDLVEAVADIVPLIALAHDLGVLPDVT